MKIDGNKEIFSPKNSTIADVSKSRQLKKDAWIDIMFFLYILVFLIY